MSEKLLLSEHFPQAGNTWTDNPYTLATDICRWVNHERLMPGDVVSVSIFAQPILSEHAVGAVVFYWR